MDLSDITVISSLTGGKDTLREDQIKGNAHWIAFTDFEFASQVWQYRPAYNKFASPRRNSRVPKLLAHQFVNTKYSIWIDANIALLVTPEELVERYLKDHDVALFAHPSRNCLYDEAMVCAVNKLDDPETIIAQVKQYEDEGYGKQRGLCEGGFIIRRHTPKVEQFNNYWWSEYCRHSVRDQLSMMYAFDKAGLQPNVIHAPYVGSELEAKRADVFSIKAHLTARPE
jgi:hypothetical protein